MWCSITWWIAGERDLYKPVYTNLWSDVIMVECLPRHDAADLNQTDVCSVCVHLCYVKIVKINGLWYMFVVDDDK